MIAGQRPDQCVVGGASALLRERIAAAPCWRRFVNIKTLIYAEKYILRVLVSAVVAATIMLAFVVGTADAEFFTRVIEGAPHPATSYPTQANYPGCRT